MSHRIERVNSEMKKSLSDIINNRLRDPRVTEMVSVLKVDVAKDLKTAKVLVSVYGDKERCAQTFEGLKGSSGFIKGQLAVDFKALRTIPTLTFILDDSMDYSDRINTLIREIKPEK